MLKFMILKLITAMLATCFCLLLPGCVGAPLSAAELAVIRTRAIADENKDFETGMIRYNPARCNCPDFELLSGKRWLRIHILNDREDDPVAARLFSLSSATGPGWTTYIRGKIKGIYKKEYRTPVLRLDVESICASAGCKTTGIGADSDPHPDAGPTDGG